MRIIFLGNNWVGWQVLKHLADQNENIVGLVVHPEDKRKYGNEILDTIELENSSIFEAKTLRDPKVIEQIAKLKPQMGISAFFGYILKPDFLNLFPQGVINIHPALLPYNRGSYPNVWSIIGETPSGTTIHYIDPGIDTGPIIAQQKVTVNEIDTGQSLYQKLEKASLELFIQTWPKIRSGHIDSTSQKNDTGTYHRTRDVEQIDEINLHKSYLASELINIIRARTFPPHRGAYFLDKNGEKVYLRLELFRNEDEENQ